MGALLEAYPDACLVWIHRDPVVTSASFVELISQIYEGIAGSVDRAATAAGNVAGIRDRIAGIMNDPLVDDRRILHVPYHEFTLDPVDAIKRIYARFDLPYSHAFADHIRAWLAANKPNRHGEFRYSMGTLGVAVEDLYGEFAPYMERFWITRESRR